MIKWFHHVVCWMIKQQLYGQMIALQSSGVDFDAGQVSGVYAVADGADVRYVVSVSCLHPVSTKLGFTIIKRSFEYPAMKWDAARQQFVVPNCDA